MNHHTNEALDIVQSHCDVYCLCYQNEEKKRSMIERWKAVGISLIVHDGVPHNDVRLQHPLMTPGIQRLWSVTYGHIDMIQQWLNSDKEFGLFCEDDILVHKDIVSSLPYIMSDMNTLPIDFLLLGYMSTFPIQPWMEMYRPITPIHPALNHHYHQYPSDQWGVHLYMLNRKAAQTIVDTFAYPSFYAINHIHHPDKPFSPDWTISKCPGIQCALLSPMLAVEDGQDSYEHYEHISNELH